MHMSRQWWTFAEAVCGRAQVIMIRLAIAAAGGRRQAIAGEKAMMEGEDIKDYYDLKQNELKHNSKAIKLNFT